MNFKESIHKPLMFFQSVLLSLNILMRKNIYATSIYTCLCLAMHWPKCAACCIKRFGFGVNRKWKRLKCSLPWVKLNPLNKLPNTIAFSSIQRKCAWHAKNLGLLKIHYQCIIAKNISPASLKWTKNYIWQLNYTYLSNSSSRWLGFDDRLYFL